MKHVHSPVACSAVETGGCVNLNLLDTSSRFAGPAGQRGEDKERENTSCSHFVHLLVFVHLSDHCMLPTIAAPPTRACAVLEQDALPTRCLGYRVIFIERVARDPPTFECRIPRKRTLSLRSARRLLKLSLR